MGRCRLAQLVRWGHATLALVTGASAGIGRSIAADLASRGYDIVGVGSSAKVEDLASELTQTLVHPVRAGLSTREGVDQVWREVEPSIARSMSRR